jgi:hypothetical protein
MPFRARTLAVALAVASAALTCASSASAGGQLILSNGVPTGQPGLSGPVLGGDRVVWAEQFPVGTWRVRSAPLGHARSATDSKVYSPGSADSGRLALAASPSHIAVSANLYDCPGEDCDLITLVRDQLAIRTDRGPFEVLEDCPGGGCSPDVCNDPVRWVPALSGHILAYNGDPCATDGTVVWRDLAPAADHSPHTIAARAATMAAAGRYLAWTYYTDPETQRVVVYDRVADAEAYHVEILPAQFAPTRIDVQADGKVLWVNRNRLEWASAAEPSAHRVSSGWFVDPRIAGDRVAFVRPDFGRGRSAARVLDLDGERIASTAVDGLAGGLDFDGTRVTFGSQPCQTAAIVVWDLAGPVPRQPRKRCPAARIANRHAVRTADDKLEVRLACLGTAKLGCIGRLRLVADGRGRHASGSQGLHHLGVASYEIGRGRARTASIELTEDGTTFLDAHPRARVVATSISLQRPDLGIGHHFQTLRRTLSIERRP